MTALQEIADYLNKLKSDGLLRGLHHHRGVDFSSNDYLGLSNNKASIDAGMRAAQDFGSGSTGSRLLSGNRSLFEEFEKEIAADKNFEDALIFNSGYVANLSVVSAFAAMGYVVIFDKANHASMYHGALNTCTLERYRHLDYAHLESVLEKHKEHPKKLIVSETVFGMDGDIADIERLMFLSGKYNGILYLDEAHATGLYGANGYGVSTNYKLDKQSTIVMGTFSKALASQGAYVASSSMLKQYLMQVSKAFVYSTAIAPFSIGVARYNWNNLPNYSKERALIFEKTNYLRNCIEQKGFQCLGQGTNIILICFESTQQMLDVHRRLLEQGIVTAAIRRPTAPTPRIRISVNAGHSYDDLSSLVDALP